MPPQIKLTVSGAGALKLTLDEIVGKIARRAARRAVTEASKLILEVAKANVPKDTGALKKSLGRKVAALKSGGGYIAIIGPRYDSKKLAAKGRKKRFGKYRRRKGYAQVMFVNPVKYAHLVEYGTRPHAIGKGSKLRGSNRLSRAFGLKGKQVGVMHPVGEARPFMRPAGDATQGAVKEIMKRRFRELISEAVIVAK